VAYVDNLRESENLPLQEAIVAAILETTDLAESTAHRRAGPVKSLILAAQNPYEFQWHPDKTVPALDLGQRAALDDAVRGTLDRYGVLHVDELHTRVRKHVPFDLDKTTLGSSLAASPNKFARLPGGHWYLAGLDEQCTWSHWNSNQTAILDAARSDELGTCDPPLVWSLARFIAHFLDRDHEAIALMDALLARGDLAATLRQEINELKVARSMGMG